MFTFVEKQIEDWIARNEHESLPGKGRPLDLDEYFRCPEEWRLGFSILKNSGFVPEEVELLKEIQRLSEEIERIKDHEEEKQLRQRLQEQQVSLNMRLEQSRLRRR